MVLWMSWIPLRICLCQSDYTQTHIYMYFRSRMYIYNGSDSDGNDGKGSMYDTIWTTISTSTIHYITANTISANIARFAGCSVSTWHELIINDEDYAPRLTLSWYFSVNFSFHIWTIWKYATTINNQFSLVVWHFDLGGCGVVVLENGIE